MSWTDFSNTSVSGKSFWQDFLEYVGRVREFTQHDWLIYIIWVGMMSGLFVSVFAFFAFGNSHAISYPAYVWGIPVGSFIFCLSIAIDTIGHRTIYREELKKGESLVHGITIVCGVSSVIFLCLAKDEPKTYGILAGTLILLSVIYSLIDEALHWTRYLKGKSDRVEMCSHFGIFLGHFLFVGTWWIWFSSGYQGIHETFALLNL